MHVDNHRDDQDHNEEHHNDHECQRDDQVDNDNVGGSRRPARAQMLGSGGASVSRPILWTLVLLNYQAGTGPHVHRLVAFLIKTVKLSTKTAVDMPGGGVHRPLWCGTSFNFGLFG